MNSKLIILSMMIVILFAGCKKEKQEFNKNTVRVVTLPVDQGAVLKTGPSNDYLLQGTIIAPSEVEIKDHGFIIGGSTYLKLGSGKMIGHFENTYTSAATVYDNMLVAYLVFPDGDSIRSDRSGVIPGTGVAPDAYLAGFLIDPVGPGNTNLSLSTFWNYNSGYYIQTETLYYKDNKNTTWNTFPLPVNSNLTNYSLNTNVSGLATAGGTLYDFKVVVKMHPPSTITAPVITISTAVKSVIYQ
jgi:hypothetical protein